MSDFIPPVDFVPNQVVTSSDLNDILHNIRLFYDPPRARVYRDTVSQIPTGTNNMLPFNQERWDSQDLHSNVTNNTRLTAPIGGIYLIGALVTWAPNTSGSRQVYIIVNGVAIVAGSVTRANSEAGFGTAQAIVGAYALQVGDYAEVRVRHDAGGAAERRGRFGSGDVGPGFLDAVAMWLKQKES